MRFTRLKLKNWRNFKSVEVLLTSRRMFIVGANASGKSNLLDAFRFLRDIADPEGGLQRAVAERAPGMGAIRSLFARRDPEVLVEVDVVLDASDAEATNGAATEPHTWTYSLAFDENGKKRARVVREVVRRDSEILLNRARSKDESDEEEWGQTSLEQVQANKAFRLLVNALASVRYLHLVPQLLRFPEMTQRREHAQQAASERFGASFLQQLAEESKRSRDSKLKRIGKALKSAVPRLSELGYDTDARGAPHLRAKFEHWRPGAGIQDETQFSDGTLRLIALFWSLLDASGPLLLEEPELSLHPAVVRKLPTLIWRAIDQSNRQCIMSTHSPDLLSDEGIDPSEILLLVPDQHGEATTVERAADIRRIRDIMVSGIAPADVVLPYTEPKDLRQLLLFGNK